MTIEWQASMLPEVVALATAVGIAGGALGAFIAGGLQLRPDISGVPRAWAGALASLLVIGATVGFLLIDKAPEGRGVVTLTEVRGGPEREVNATVRFEPASLADNADWITTIAWQGGEPRRVAPLRRVGEGVYETTAPLPVSGSWKTMIRLHRGSELASIPVYMPADAAIPVAVCPRSPASSGRSSATARRSSASARTTRRPGCGQSPAWSCSASHSP